MREIDLDTWDRTEYFVSYLGTDFPYINIGANIDVTNLISFCSANKLSSYIAMVHRSHLTAESIENFGFRIRDGRVIANEEPMRASFTYIPEGRENFINITIDFVEDIFAFHEAAKDQIARQGLAVGAEGFRDKDNVIMYSAIPWIQYTHFVRSIRKLGVDSTPKISWGKYFPEGDRIRMPFSVQVHHGLMDGLHVGKYFERLQANIDRLGKGGA
jgi:chloramphenicol O-acetyltransferase type A